jgi:gamma-glutamyltranspeptidase / glutathione hydrolase
MNRRDQEFAVLRIWLVLVWMAAALSLPAGQLRAQPTALDPEASTGSSVKTLSVASKYMIASAHPLASEAGREILRKGGSAIDAVIAAQLVLGLVEPQSSGLGGGAFLVLWDEKAKALTTIDGRETAPAAAKPDRFMNGAEPKPFLDAVRSGLSVGTPGVVAAMEIAHKKHGKLPWADLFQPAIRLADNSFQFPARLTTLLRWIGSEHFSPTAKSYFFDAGGSARSGDTIKNPDYATSLKAIAAGGAKAFYEGSLAQSIVDAVANGKGDLTLADLAGYKPVERAPVCVTYRSNRICGMGPPSSGAITIGQILKLIEPFSIVQGPAAAMTTPVLHLIVEAERLAYADRGKYLADPDFVAIPSGMLDDAYLAERHKLIDPKRAMDKASPGSPPGIGKRAHGVDATHEVAGTSHISVIDADGNAVAMTTTIESAFGSGHWAGGFLLNNQLTDFSLKPVDDTGTPIANAVQPGKRPRSSMSPTMVFDKDGKLSIVTGSPGGGRIIQYVAKTLIAMLDWGMDAQEAAALMNFGSDGGPVTFDFGINAVWPALVLKTYGHKVSTDLLVSGVHTVARRNGRLEGGADPRRDGVALGD